VQYPDAVAAMEARVAAIASGTASEQVCLQEHPALYTAGTSAKESDLLLPDRFPVFRTGRGGQYTYHGPGQRIAYLMLDLNRRQPDLRLFVATIEEWIIRTLAHFNVKGERRQDRIGIWVRRPDKGPDREDKIAAIGVRIRHWITFHGVAINIDPELEHFSGIVPCGVREQGVTSLADLGIVVSMAEVDMVLRREFEVLFGAATPSAGS
jgi:lipoyl(octanoyl) transferase